MHKVHFNSHAKYDIEFCVGEVAGFHYTYLAPDLIELQNILSAVTLIYSMDLLHVDSLVNIRSLMAYDATRAKNSASQRTC